MKPLFGDRVKVANVVTPRVVVRGKANKRITSVFDAGRIDVERSRFYSVSGPNEIAKAFRGDLKNDG